MSEMKIDDILDLSPEIATYGDGQWANVQRRMLLVDILPRRFRQDRRHDWAEGPSADWFTLLPSLWECLDASTPAKVHRKCSRKP